MKASASLVKSLGSVGAIVHPFEVAEGGDVERAFFDWLEDQLLALSEVIERSCKFASLFSIEVGFNLLEGLGFQHVGGLANAGIVIGSGSREGANEAVK